MSNYIDSAQVGGTDYPIRVPNGVTYRNPSAMTPSTNPLIRRNDLVQTLSDDENNPPSSKAVKTVTDSLNSELTNVTPIQIFSGAVSFTSGRGDIASSSIPYSHFYPMCAYCDGFPVHAFYNSTNGIGVCLTQSGGFTGSLNVQIYGLAWN